jgi:tetratricopeptide (TPR) repeat protein
MDLKASARDFEEIAFKLIEDQFHVPHEALLTPPSKDGGVDAKFEAALFGSEKKGARFRALMEAKLRAEKDLRLEVIGKSVVIAFNWAANALFIVTNCKFAPQALKHLTLFERKSNLQIVLVDGPTLSAWANATRETLRRTKNLNQDLVDFICRIPRAMKAEKVRVDPDPDISIDDYVSTTAEAIRYEVELGWKRDRVADCRLRPTKRGVAWPMLPCLMSAKREALVAAMVAPFSRAPIIAMLTGAAGIGKSLVVDHIRRELSKNKVASTTISMEGITSKRVFYMRLISAILSVDVEPLARDANEKQLLSVLARSGGEPVPDDQQKAVAQILRNDMRTFEANTKENVSILGKYLRTIASALGPHLFVFQNLEKSVLEVLRLLPAVALSLQAAKVSTLYEVRRFGESALRTTEEASHAALSSDEWDVALSLLRDDASLRHEVEPLEYDEAVVLVMDLLKGIGRERAKVVVDRVGTNPFFLTLAAAWMRDSEVVLGPVDAVAIADLERFFERINPDSVLTLLRNHVALWWPRLKHLLAAASLLDGRLSWDILARFERRTDADREPGAAMASELVHSRIFEEVRSREVRLVHGLLHEELDAVFRGRRSFDFADARIVLTETAGRLLPFIQSIYPDEHARLLKMPHVLAAAGRWSEALEHARTGVISARTLKQWPEVTLLNRLALNAVEGVPEWDEPRRVHERLAILIDLLSAERTRHRIALDVNAPYVAQLTNIVRTSPELDSTLKGREQKATAFLIESKHHYSREEFNDALAAAKEGSTFTWKWKNELLARGELCQELLRMHGLALKGLEQREKSFEIFELAIKRFPTSLRVRNERLSNLAAFNLVRSPSVARSYYEQIIASEIDRDPTSRLHEEIDIAMADFLSGDYVRAAREAETALGYTLRTRNYTEIARARNILGCCHWALRKTKAAYAEFEAACAAAERTLTKRYLWRMHVNRAGTALEQNDRAQALASSLVAEQMVVRPRADLLKTFARHPAYRESRWYVALVALGSYYNSLDMREYSDFVARIGISVLEEDVANAVARLFTAPPFQRTKHVHNDRIMITG